MNELTRLAYLQAMGTDSYVSRGQLPGAAATRRLAIVRRQAPGPAQADSRQQDKVAPQVLRNKAPGIELPRVETARPAPVAVTAQVRKAEQPLPARFSVAAISCGGWLWLEELDSASFGPEQLQLIQAMVHALGIARASAGSSDSAAAATPGGAQPQAVATRFDWPMHSNQQLDQGPEAARASLAGFIQRKLEERECRGLVLLGRESEARVALDQLDCAYIARTLSTAELLRDPLLKKQVWRDLRPFFEQA